MGDQSGPVVGVTRQISYVPLFSQFFMLIIKTLLNVTFVFDMCQTQQPVDPLGKYEREFKCLIFTFANSKFPIAEKLIDRALVAPTPAVYGQLWYWPLSRLGSNGFNGCGVALGIVRRYECSLFNALTIIDDVSMALVWLQHCNMDSKSVSYVWPDD